MHSLGIFRRTERKNFFFYMVLWLAYVTMVYTGIYWTPRLVSHVPYYKAIRLGKRKDSDIPIFVIKAFPTTLQIGITSIPLSLFYYWTRVIYEFGNNHAWLILLIEYTIPYTKLSFLLSYFSHTFPLLISFLSPLSSKTSFWLSFLYCFTFQLIGRWNDE